MNKERIEELAAIIERQPHADILAAEGFSMLDFEHPCGTPACIGGWASHVFDVHHGDWVRDNGRDALGLSDDDADDLFGPMNVENYASITPTHAAAVLRNLAATGEVDWSVTAPVEAV